MLEKYLSGDFIKTLIDQIGTWVIAVTPSLLLLIVLYWIVRQITKKVYNLVIEKSNHKFEASGDLEGKKRVMTIATLVETVLLIVIQVIFIVLLLSQLGLDIAPLITGAGIVGLAVGFGSQELVRDFISGFFIILEDQIRVGDIVNINGFGGVVEKIEIRTITLRDYGGVVHIIQNGKINSISNLTKGWSAVNLDVGVSYKEDADRVIGVMEKVASGLKADEEFQAKVLEDIEIGGLDKFGDSAIIIKARIKVIPGAQWAVGREYNKRLKKAFDEQDIEIPFPHRTIIWRTEDVPGEVKEARSGR